MIYIVKGSRTHCGQRILSVRMGIPLASSVKRHFSRHMDQNLSTAILRDIESISFITTAMQSQNWPWIVLYTRTLSNPLLCSEISKRLKLGQTKISCFHYSLFFSVYENFKITESFIHLIISSWTYSIKCRYWLHRDLVDSTDTMPARAIC